MITVRTPDNRLQSLTIFEVFAALSAGQIADFPALRPHQREPWHCFCVQVAALALLEGERADLPKDAATWEALLKSEKLTPEHPDEAWSLVVDDWTKPALLQPPIPANQPKCKDDYKSVVETPDLLDMLVTSKNHDLKRMRMAAASQEDWLFALVTLQTYEGGMGAGNYGISRMNGAYGSRLSFGIRALGTPSAQFRHDVEALLAKQVERWGEPGHGLLWTLPWTGQETLAFTDLHELYVDVCRRIRLVANSDGALQAKTATSKASRIAAKELNGLTGDPWAPIEVKTEKSVGPTADVFRYKKLNTLLNGELTQRPYLGLFRQPNPNTHYVLRGATVVRGQGQTDGFHSFSLPLSDVDPDDGRYLDRMGQVATLRREDAGQVSKRLNIALMKLAEGGAEDISFDNTSAVNKAKVWLARYDDAVDSIFFDDGFWAMFAAAKVAVINDNFTYHETRFAYLDQLYDIARSVLKEAAASLPATTVKRHRAAARAHNLLEGKIAWHAKEVRKAIQKEAADAS